MKSSQANEIAHEMTEIEKLELIVPECDVSEPELSIVVPALNEETTIVEFIAWCKDGLSKSGIVGEILIVDSSTDKTSLLAVEHGARVLKTPRRGLGRAYIDAIPFIRGKYIVMGDADCTYDFRDVGLFVDKMRSGYEFVMGSRWLGSIEAGAMPALHRSIGTPLTTWILNRIYGSNFTDIHCGMRGITKESLNRIGLSSQSWEYASEMVLKSVTMNLKTVEVPVNFYKDRDGRLSHHKRSGWTSPFQAAWINLKAMFTYRVEYFVMKPGLLLTTLGLLLTLPLTFGSISMGPITFSLYWMLLGLTLVVLGQQSFYFGCLAQIFCDYSGRSRKIWTSRFSYTRSMLISGLLLILGVGCEALLAERYIADRFQLPQPTSMVDHIAITGLVLMITGFSLFCFTLLLHATGVKYGSADDNAELSKR